MPICMILGMDVPAKSCFPPLTYGKQLIEFGEGRSGWVPVQFLATRAIWTVHYPPKLCRRKPSLLFDTGTDRMIFLRIPAAGYFAHTPTIFVYGPTASPAPFPFRAISAPLDFE